MFKVRKLAVELTEISVRLAYWREQPHIKKKRAYKEKVFQEGKLYAHVYMLQRLGYAFFWYPNYVRYDGYEPLLFQIKIEGRLREVFIHKDIFESAVSRIETVNPKLKRDIDKWRKQRIKRLTK